MTRRIPAVAVLALVLAQTGCGNPFGVNTPVCDTQSSALILSAQALPGTEFVPCINSLKTDWVYDDLRAKRGLATFGLGSLSMGTSFLRVTLQPTCDTSSARRVASDEPGVPLFVDVVDDDLIRVVVVPDDRGPTITEYARGLVGELDGSVLADRRVVARLDQRGTPVTSRIAEAHDSGSVVLIVTVRDSEQRAVTVLLPGRDEERAAVPVADIAETLREINRPATYSGSWYYPFPHGCVVYAFDAHGGGVATIEADVKAALGLYDAQAMRQQARDLGYDVR